MNRITITTATTTTTVIKRMLLQHFSCFKTYFYKSSSGISLRIKHKYLVGEFFFFFFGCKGLAWNVIKSCDSDSTASTTWTSFSEIVSIRKSKSKKKTNNGASSTTEKGIRRCTHCASEIVLKLFHYNGLDVFIEKILLIISNSRIVFILCYS